MQPNIVEENLSLKELTTIRVGGLGRYYAVVSSRDDLDKVMTFAKDEKLPIFVLGGGSNVVISDNGFDGLVIHPEFTGREVLADTDDHVVIKVASGENLDNVIGWVVENGWCGIENLSFVPGDIGGLAIQNVNCYGHDASKVIESVDVYDLTENKYETFSNEQCNFAYRSSRFNTTDKNRYLVVSVTMKLMKKCDPVLIYPDVVKWFEGRDTDSITIEEIRRAITHIRTEKGQDTNEFLSAGSFFKNLVLRADEYNLLHVNIRKNFGDELAEKLDEVKNKFDRVETVYKTQTGVGESNREKKIKIPIAFILDKVLNLKGTSVGDSEISQRTAIVIRNMGNATADDVMRLFKKVRQMVYEKTGMKIVNEPELVGFSKEELERYFAL